LVTVLKATIFTPITSFGVSSLPVSIYTILVIRWNVLVISKCKTILVSVFMKTLKHKKSPLKGKQGCNFQKLS
jgi:hypothetical protein